MAVLTVAVFMSVYAGVGGGFVGVDIFFVISGYLITRILASRVGSGGSLRRLLRAACRRILPAFFVMLAFAASSHRSPVAGRLPGIRRHRRGGGPLRLQHAVLRHYDYFGQLPIDKPLLHTWSLAVEEQFISACRFVLWGLVARGPEVATLPLTLGGTDGGLVRPQHRADAHRPLREALLHEVRRGCGSFSIGGLVALPEAPSATHTRTQLGVRAIALVMMVIPILSLRAGPGLPGVTRRCRALAPRSTSAAGSACRRRSGRGIRTTTSSGFSADLRRQSVALDALPSRGLQNRASALTAGSRRSRWLSRTPVRPWDFP